MPMHPHAKPNFRNLFWYPFKITLITALRTFPFFGKWLGKKLDWGYHNSEHPEFLDAGSKSRATKTSEFNDISVQTFAPDRVTSDLFPTLWSLKQFSILTSDLRKWSHGFSFQAITTEELESFGRRARLVNCA